MKQTTIKINGQELTLKRTFKALMQFEALSGKSAFGVSISITDGLKMFYCMLSAANENFSPSFSEFLTILDEDPGPVEQFYKYMASLVEDKTEKAINKKKVEKRKR